MAVELDDAMAALLMQQARMQMASAMGTLLVLRNWAEAKYPGDRPPEGFAHAHKHIPFFRQEVQGQADTLAKAVERLGYYFDRLPP